MANGVELKYSYVLVVHIAVTQNSPDVRFLDIRFLFLSLLPISSPKHEYNAASTIVNETWQYRMGGDLTIFNKDYDTTEADREGSCS